MFLSYVYPKSFTVFPSFFFPLTLEPPLLLFGVSFSDIGGLMVVLVFGAFKQETQSMRKNKKVRRIRITINDTVR